MAITLVLINVLMVSVENKYTLIFQIAATTKQAEDHSLVYQMHKKKTSKRLPSKSMALMSLKKSYAIIMVTQLWLSETKKVLAVSI